MRRQGTNGMLAVSRPSGYLSPVDSRTWACHIITLGQVLVGGFIGMRLGTSTFNRTTVSQNPGAESCVLSRQIS